MELLGSEIAPQRRSAIPEFAWAQDGAPARLGEETIKWLAGAAERAECGRFVNEWPPASPDLNPCDFWLWNHIKTKLHGGAYEHDAAPKLQDSILEITDGIRPKAIRKACVSFWKRAKWVLGNEGKFIVGKAYKKPPSRDSA